MPNSGLDQLASAVEGLSVEVDDAKGAQLINTIKGFKCIVLNLNGSQLKYCADSGDIRQVYEVFEDVDYSISDLGWDDYRLMTLETKTQDEQNR